MFCWNPGGIADITGQAGLILLRTQISYMELVLTHVFHIHYRGWPSSCCGGLNDKCSPQTHVFENSSPVVVLFGEVIEHLGDEVTGGGLWGLYPCPWVMFISSAFCMGMKCDQPAPWIYCLLPCLLHHDGLQPSRNSLNKVFPLQIASVVLFSHSIRKATNTVFPGKNLSVVGQFEMSDGDYWRATLISISAYLLMACVLDHLFKDAYMTNDLGGK